MKLISILSGKGFVMYNKELAHSVSVNGSIIFGQLCSSYESFGSKGMLKIRDNKEYFFLTSETLEEETALTYKQQMKAVKELENAGYIETKIMGVPSKKYFHITDKIVNELLPSSDKKSDLNEPENPALMQAESYPSFDKREELENQELQKESSSLDERENLALSKGDGKDFQKGSSIKKKNKKEKIKEINKDNFVNNVVNNESIDYKKIFLKKQDEERTQEVWKAINELTNEYRLRGLSKAVAMRVVKEALEKEKEVENFGGYLRSCLETTLHRVNIKLGKEQPRIYDNFTNEPGKVPFYNWLDEVEEKPDEPDYSWYYEYKEEQGR
ncbi:hypothetical protein COJ96_26455 [Bacillus sp. AFS073361]|uniref:hypothetical protein n=1 Tax=Bacillus sp. AFS073361 TaxID=2033511 RepID=UPI000BF56B14|nr:hypothetical protein [Bacillus sp. AFS073361]PFP17556.1 hypothetical protein COJ96_26455 [Bacillus sp. AFS073361]